MTDRRRNGLVLLLVAGLLAASVVAIIAKKTRLGLDLKGGVELVYQGKPSAAQPVVTQDALQRAVDIMRQRIDAIGVGEPELTRTGKDLITVGLPDVKDFGRAERQVGTPAQLAFYDWEANLIAPDGKTVAESQAAGDQAAAALSSAAGDPSAGQTLYAAVKLAAKRPPGPQGARRGSEYWLFRKDKAHTFIAGPAETTTDLFSERFGGRQPPGTELVTIPQGTIILQAVDRNAKSTTPVTRPDLARWYVLKDRVALFGKDIKDPKQGSNSQRIGNPPDVEFSFTKPGRTAFHDVTRRISQRGSDLFLPGSDRSNPPLQHFAVALDKKLVSVASIDFNDPQLKDGIDGEQGAQIEGGFTITTAQDLANLLKLGALPIGLKLISQSQVSASLGKEALHQGLIAGVAGLAIVVLFLLAFYRVLGLIATVALGIYAIYFYALIKLVPITLTLPGIAGLILTIGVAADANIVIFERVKEEVRAGSSIARGIAVGYKKGLTAIVDANVVTLMTAFILFVLATAGVKGFAFTLGIGTIVSFLTAVMATQAILGTMGRSRAISRPSALGAGGESRTWRFDFMGSSKYFFSMSGMILLVGALAIGGKGLNFGIDFESGTRITTALSAPNADENQLRTVLSGAGSGDAKIQRISDKNVGANAFQISTRTLQPDRVKDLKKTLNGRFGGTPNFTSRSVGPTFGQTVANSAIVAILASLLVISAYIALRFEWKFAVPVLIALMHDLLITAGVYSLTGREVTTATVAALLTILGYSLYDTIIVFDRVRENVPRMPRAAFSQIVNRSMSEVLTRSAATTLCTLLPVIALLLFGGATLKDFAFALLIGVASGAYSSIFIASPVLTHWKEREPVYVARRHRLEDAAPDGRLPAYAEARGGGPVDVEPRARKPMRGSITAPEPDQISPREFEELKRNLGVEEAPRPRRQAATAAAAARPPRAERRTEPLAGDGDGDTPRANRHADDEAENDGMLRSDKPKPRAKQKRPRNRRHGRNR